MVMSALYTEVSKMFDFPQVREADPLAGASRLSQGVLLRRRQDDLHHEREVERKGEVARAEGLEPPTLSHTTSAFAADPRAVRGLDSAFAMSPKRCRRDVSSLYTFPLRGLARRSQVKGSPNLRRSTP